jgi:hypothetical protein
MRVTDIASPPISIAVPFLECSRELAVRDIPSPRIFRPNRVVKNGSVVSILRVLTKRGGDDEKTGGVSTELR